MYKEVWNASASGETKEKLRKYVRYHTEQQMFPPEAIQALQQAVDPGAAQAPAPPPGRVDPRSRARPGSSATPAQRPLPAPRPAAAPVPPPNPAHSQAAFGISYDPTIPAYNAAPQWPRAPGQLPPPSGAVPYGPAHGAPMDPLAQYRAAQGFGAAMPPRPHMRPLGTSFKGVRLQVRCAPRWCNYVIFPRAERWSGCRSPRQSGVAQKRVLSAGDTESAGQCQWGSGIVALRAVAALREWLCLRWRVWDCNAVLDQVIALACSFAAAHPAVETSRLPSQRVSERSLVQHACFCHWVDPELVLLVLWLEGCLHWLSRPCLYYLCREKPTAAVTI